MEELPRHVDTLIIGGGTTGSALAGLLAERSEESILVLEGGPDFGSHADGGWPQDVLDATWLSESFQLGYASDDGYRGRRVEFQRAGMIGGCSSHNGCAAIWGSALDYDGLAASGLDGWSRAEVEPLLRAANERMRVRIPDEAELAPFHRASLASLVAAGVPRVDDLNDLDADTGAAPFPANIVDGVRWNAALAYLDPVRERPSLRIAGDSPAERLLVEGGTGARGDRAARRRARDGERRAHDRVRRRLRLPRPPAALGDRAGRRPARARHPRRGGSAGRRSEPARPSGIRAPVRRDARAPPGLRGVRRERRIRTDRGRDREAALGAVRAPRDSTSTSTRSAASCATAAASSGSRWPA